jgi:hypothetical protein
MSRHAGSITVRAIDPPIPYNDRARKAAPKYGICLLCNHVRDLILDHCHKHDLVRGSVCYSCNMRMCYVDGGYYTSRYYPQIYHEWRYRCADCTGESF